MNDHAENLSRRLEVFRPWLALLARLHLDSGLRGKVDLSGVVQQTLYEAWQALQQEAQAGTEDFTPLLRRFLANNLADEVRKLFTSLEAALQDSSARLEAFLAAQHSSPGERAERAEDMARLAAALETLPEAQRQAVELHYLHSWSLAEVAEELGRSKPAVAGLLHRGLEELRSRLNPGESSHDRTVPGIE
jgi:RNA polymerase sigma-70 factor (ECF subfamily)